jgi:hypothetical protein
MYGLLRGSGTKNPGLIIMFLGIQFFTDTINTLHFRLGLKKFI